MISLPASALVLASLFIFGNTSNAQARAESQGQAVTAYVHQSTHRLKNVNRLPGFGQMVTEAQHEQLLDSTVKLLVRDALSGWVWDETCTGVKTAMTDPTSGQAVVGVAVSAHCAAFITGNAFGTNKAGEGYFADVHERAADLLDPATEQVGVAIADPRLPIPDREADLIEVSDWVVSLRDEDFSLVFPNLGSPGLTPAAENWYDQMPALQAEPPQGAQHPAPGEAVALLGVPGSSGNLPVGGEGIYIGIADEPASDAANRRLYAVAIDAPSAASDPCQYGASGSAAITASGAILFDLSLRISLGYGPNHEIVPPDPPRKAAEGEWKEVEETTGVALDQKHFNTICLFGTPTAQDWRDLVGGKGNFVPWAPPGQATPK